MEVEVNWKYVEDGTEELDFCRVLYAYIHPDGEDILYIGKADKCSVRERLDGRHKEEIFKYFEDELELQEMGLLVGELLLPEQRNYSSELLTDVESLLINKLDPCANISSTKTRISRPRLSVLCIGEWPDEEYEFFDE